MSAQIWHKFIVFARIAALIALLPLAAPAWAETVQMGVQGALRSQNGGPVADGNYALSIGLYPQALGGVAVFEEPFLAVAVVGGGFALTMGANKYPLDSAALATGAPLWVGVTVGTDELTRVPLTRVPHAVHALIAKVANDLQCSACVGSEDLAKGAVTADKVAFNWAVSDSPGGSALNAVTAKQADLAKLAVQASFAEEAAGLNCSGCVITAQIADGAVTAKKLAATALDWTALQNVPGGFADGIDNTVSDADVVKAVGTAPVKLAGGSTMGGQAIARIMSSYTDALADGKSVILDTGLGAPPVIAQAWFYDAVNKLWIQANSAQNASNAGSCSDCGSGADGLYNPQVSGVLATNKKYNFTQFLIPKGVTITVTGSAALEIKASQKIQIDGVLLLDGGAAPDSSQGVNGCSPNYGASVAGAAAPGGYIGGATAYGNWNPVNGDGPGGGKGAGNGNSYGNGGGGGGAGYAALGADGALAGVSSSQQPGGAGGAAYQGIVDGTLQGGSGGGAGGYGSSYNAGGAGGGGGGGAIKLESPQISISGSISANGGKGGAQLNACDGGAGGGGAGGAVWLRAAKIDIGNNLMSVAGGAGGSIDLGSGSDGGKGGIGSVGRIRIDCPGAVVGASTPAFVKGDSAGLTVAPTNSFSIDQPSLGAVRLTNLTGGVQKVHLVVTY